VNTGTNDSDSKEIKESKEIKTICTSVNTTDRVIKCVKLGKYNHRTILNLLSKMVVDRIDIDMNGYKSFQVLSSYLDREESKVKSIALHFGESRSDDSAIHHSIIDKFVDSLLMSKLKNLRIEIKNGLSEDSINLETFIKFINKMNSIRFLSSITTVPLKLVKSLKTLDISFPLNPHNYDYDIAHLFSRLIYYLLKCEKVALKRIVFRSYGVMETDKFIKSFPNSHGRVDNGDSRNAVTELRLIEEFNGRQMFDDRIFSIFPSLTFLSLSGFDIDFHVDRPLSNGFSQLTSLKITLPTKFGYCTMTHENILELVRICNNLQHFEFMIGGSGNGTIPGNMTDNWIQNIDRVLEEMTRRLHKLTTLTIHHNFMDRKLVDILLSSARKNLGKITVKICAF
jgi:hypothetical protein